MKTWQGIRGGQVESGDDGHTCWFRLAFIASQHIVAKRLHAAMHKPHKATASGPCLTIVYRRDPRTHHCQSAEATSQKLNVFYG